MRVLQLLGVTSILFVLASCGPDSGEEANGADGTAQDDAPIASEEQIESFVESVGMALVENDWSAIHGKFSEAMAAEMSPQDVEQAYKTAADQVSSTFQPIRYAVYTGNLPLDAKEAEDVYGIRGDVSPSTWRKWTIISLHERDDDEGPMVDARFLVVQIGEDLLIAHIEFARTV